MNRLPLLLGVAAAACGLTPGPAHAQRGRCPFNMNAQLQMQMQMQRQLQQQQLQQRRHQQVVPQMQRQMLQRQAQVLRRPAPGPRLMPTRTATVRNIVGPPRRPMVPQVRRTTQIHRVTTAQRRLQTVRVPQPSRQYVPRRFGLQRPTAVRAPRTLTQRTALRQSLIRRTTTTVRRPTPVPGVRRPQMTVRRQTAVPAPRRALTATRRPAVTRSQQRAPGRRYDYPSRTAPRVRRTEQHKPRVQVRVSMTGTCGRCHACTKPGTPAAPPVNLTGPLPVGVLGPVRPNPAVWLPPRGPRPALPLVGLPPRPLLVVNPPLLQPPALPALARVPANRPAVALLPPPPRRLPAVDPSPRPPERLLGSLPSAIPGLAPPELPRLGGLALLPQLDLPEAGPRPVARTPADLDLALPPEDVLRPPALPPLPNGSALGVALLPGLDGADAEPDGDERPAARAAVELAHLPPPLPSLPEALTP